MVRGTLNSIGFDILILVDRLSGKIIIVFTDLNSDRNFMEFEVFVNYSIDQLPKRL